MLAGRSGGRPIATRAPVRNPRKPGNLTSLYAIECWYMIDGVVYAR